MTGVKPRPLRRARPRLRKVDRPTGLFLRLCREKWGASVGTWMWLRSLGQTELAREHWARMDSVQRRAAKEAKAATRG